jgi:hypothetical protein
MVEQMQTPNADDVWRWRQLWKQVQATAEEIASLEVRLKK